MNPLQIIGIGLAALAIYSAIKDVNPLEVIKSTLQGKSPPASGSWSPSTSESPVTQTLAMVGSSTTQGAKTVGSFTGTMLWPTRSHRISQEYGVKNSEYASGYHTGLDIDGECGDPIWSPVSGTVSYAGFNGPYGLQVRIKVGGTQNLEVWLNHFSGIGLKIRPGEQVAPGTHIGKMGTTGNSSGCHLHFEVRVNGNPVNPHQYLGGGVVNA